jgi:hypothetical protein
MFCKSGEREWNNIKDCSFEVKNRKVSLSISKYGLSVIPYKECIICLNFDIKWIVDESVK